MNNLMIVWGPGSLAGLVIGVIVCGVFAFVALKIAKKDGARLEDLLKTIPEETKQQIMDMEYTEADKKGFYNTNAYVAKVKEDGDKVSASILFFAAEHGDFYDRKVKLSKAEADAKGIQEGAFVPALMKYDKEMHFFDYKKLL